MGVLTTLERVISDEFFSYGKKYSKYRVVVGHVDVALASPSPDTSCVPLVNLLEDVPKLFLVKTVSRHN